jgi:formate-dependent phosphoribosylglycinamide formyltransferase (GAR transformylase)
MFQSGVELIVSQPMPEVTEVLTAPHERGWVTLVRSGKSDVTVNAAHVLYLEEVPERQQQLVDVVESPD